MKGGKNHQKPLPKRELSEIINHQIIVHECDKGFLLTWLKACVPQEREPKLLTRSVFLSHTVLCGCGFNLSKESIINQEIEEIQVAAAFGNLLKS